MCNLDYIVSKIESEYPNRIWLSKKEVAKILHVSESSINRRLGENKLDEIPAFKKMGKSSKARYMFNILDVARFLTN